MVPFFGQGLNCGLEDVRVLDVILREEGVDSEEISLPPGSIDRFPPLAERHSRQTLPDPERSKSPAVPSASSWTSHVPDVRLPVPHQAHPAAPVALLPVGLVLLHTPSQSLLVQRCLYWLLWSSPPQALR